MAKRTGGFIGQDGINAPDPATGVTGTAGNEQVEVSFTSPSDVGGAAVTEYRVTDSTGAFGATGSASPITVTGLTNGTSYTFNVWAINPFGWSSPSDASDPITANALRRAFSAGGENINTINYYDLNSTGNAEDFGDLTSGRGYLGSCSSATRGLFWGGDSTNIIDYVTIATLGNATDFGDSTHGFVRTNACLSNSTRGVSAGGYTGSDTNVIEYVTIANTGNAADFGDLSRAANYVSAFASPTRGIIQSPQGSDYQYITIASTGNTTYFGDCNANLSSSAGCSSSTRGIVAGNSSNSNLMEYITIASTGNGTDFGDLTVGRGYLAAASSETKGTWSGGVVSGTKQVTIDYVTIATTGNAIDFGDLAVALGNNAGCSAAHGGLQ